MIRLAVTGKEGQVARSLIELGPKLNAMVIPLGRPELDLAAPKSILPSLAKAKPDLVVNAAAYTAVDLAEKEPELAKVINSSGAGAVAMAARQLGIPIIQLSTDYVFDGTKPTPYLESDPMSPLNVYGFSKLAGEMSVSAATDDYVILRTSWVYAPFGNNFVLTMLRLAETRSELRVVTDQRGSPTYAPDIAWAVIEVARNLLASPKEKKFRGLFHLTGSGETNWAEFAATIFAYAAGYGRKTPAVVPIKAAEYPTPARRPNNSRLDCTKLNTVHQVKLPQWEDSLQTCLTRLFGSQIYSMGEMK